MSEVPLYQEYSCAYMYGIRAGPRKHHASRRSTCLFTLNYSLINMFVYITLFTRQPPHPH